MDKAAHPHLETIVNGINAQEGGVCEKCKPDVPSHRVTGCGRLWCQLAAWLQKNRSLACWSSFPNPYDNYDYNDCPLSLRHVS